MNYYARHLGDYARDAGYLSTLEHGAYTLLLDHYYASERGIPREAAFAIARASSRVEKHAVTKVLQTFFTWDSDSGLWIHKRCELEIAKYREKAIKASRSAKTRWKSTMRTHSDGNALQEPITNNQEEPEPPLLRRIAFSAEPHGGLARVRLLKEAASG